MLTGMQYKSLIDHRLFVRYGVFRMIGWNFYSPVHSTFDVQSIELIHCYWGVKKDMKSFSKKKWLREVCNTFALMKHFMQKLQIQSNYLLLQWLEERH